MILKVRDKEMKHRNYNFLKAKFYKQQYRLDEEAHWIDEVDE